jgi:hypothetical protein
MGLIDDITTTRILIFFISFACPKRNEAKKMAPKIPTSAVFSALHLQAFTLHEKRLQLTLSNSQFKLLGSHHFRFRQRTTHKIISEEFLFFSPKSDSERFTDIKKSSTGFLT